MRNKFKSCALCPLHADIRVRRHAPDKQNGEPLIEKQLRSTTGGQKLHREPLLCCYCRGHFLETLHNVFTEMEVLQEVRSLEIAWLSQVSYVKIKRTFNWLNKRRSTYYNTLLHPLAAGLTLCKNQKVLRQLYLDKQKRSPARVF